MSDADNQMGGTGGETGPSPSQQSKSPSDPSAKEQSDNNSDVDEAGRESFPASDPPANP